ncbi:hypothetical protein F5Y12DRAFT_716314 [Xylaria sp. FL1777]|nr:hypothetical protein F5Y12DRAFT_716314 [Xylaria sp. FL1777]
MSYPKYSLIASPDQYQKDEATEPCLSDDDLQKFRTPPARHVRKTWTWFSFLYVAGVLSLIAVSYTAGFFTPRPGPRNETSSLSTSPPLASSSFSLRPLNSTQCGRTIEEALSSGCRLDFIAGAWVKPECYNKEIETEFLTISDWHWYLDKEGQEEISLDSLRATGGTNPIYVTLEYHTKHCAFAWRKLHQAISRNTPIDSHIANEQHTHHCAKSMIREPPPNQKFVPFFHLFTSCDYHENFEQYNDQD